MDNVVRKRPQKAFVMTAGAVDNAHRRIEGFEPELPKELWFGGVSSDKCTMSEEAIKELLDSASLVLHTGGQVGDALADHLRLGGNDFVSPAFFELLQELEPDAHRAFVVRVVSDVPIAGRTEHGNFYWLRPPPIIDCLLFPRTRTRDDVKGNPWDKTERFTSTGLPHKWGGGVAFSAPAYVDGSKIEGHHYWWTRQGPGSSPFTHLVTWSEALMVEVRKRQLTGWRPEHELNIVYSAV